MTSTGPMTLSENALGVYYDLGSSSYIAYYKPAESNAAVEQVGTYPTEDAASLARDIYVLKKLGLSGSKDLLNYSYEVATDSGGENCNGDVLSLIHPSGIVVNIRRDFETASSSSSSTIANSSSNSSSSNSDNNNATELTTISTANTTKATTALVSNSPALVSNPVNTFSYVPGKTDVNRKWHDRVLSSFMPTASFTYELTFPSAYASLGLQLRPHLFPYSITGSRRALACCIVIELYPFLTGRTLPYNHLRSLNLIAQL